MRTSRGPVSTTQSQASSVLINLYARAWNGVGGAYGQVLLDPWTAQVLGFIDDQGFGAAETPVGMMRP